MDPTSSLRKNRETKGSWPVNHLESSSLKCTKIRNVFGVFKNAFMGRMVFRDNFNRGVNEHL